MPLWVIAQTHDATLRVVAISEEEGTTIVGATVILAEPDADTLFAGVTDSYGFIEFSNIPARIYQIKISYIGLETHLSLIEIEPGQTRIYRPELRATSEELDEVIVSAEHRAGTVRREAGRQTITGQELQRVPSAGPGGDLTAYLQTLPSIVTTGDRGGELFVRGGTPYQNLVLVENMPIIKPFHISNLFSAFPQEALSSVDVYAGGFGAEYSGANSAVMDVNLRQGSMRRHQGAFAVSPYLYSYQLEGPITRDRHSFFLMGRHSIIENTSPSIINEEIPVQFYDLIGRYSINWPNLTCNITAIRTYDNGQINPVRQVNLNWTNTVAGLRCLGFAEELEYPIDFTIGYTGYTSSEAGVDNTGRTSNLDMGYMRLDNNVRFLGISSNYGFKVEFIRYTSELDQLFADNTRREARYLGLGSSLDEIATTFSLYFSSKWEPNSGITIQPGLTSQTKLRDLSPTLEPRLRVTYRPTNSDHSEFSFAIGRYFQFYEAITDERDAGTVFGIYKPTDEGDPYPESIHGILGYRHQFNNHIEVNFETFGKSHKNIPVARWTREPGNTLETGLANGLSYGADAQIELNFSSLYLSMGYGLAVVTYEASTNNLVAWIDQDRFRYNPTHDRRHQLNVIASYEFGKFTGNINWQYSSGGTFTRIYAFDLALQNLPDQHPLRHQGTAQTLFSEPFNARFPAFQRVDVSLNRTFSLSSRINLQTEAGLINTFNTRNVFYFDVNTMQQVDQLPLVPYVSITTRIR
ncbi:TonB-dependent receptor [Rhodohalobacter sp. SW132]|uniref:TonB-dependent receptor n=1 Tax=Rhodohalobacter sp. SW132 TaxID=2293433 RepID=UPI001315AAA0|nr:TonB-dependent receptor [Rhodohalobacter sp. SW132]